MSTPGWGGVERKLSQRRGNAKKGVATFSQGSRPDFLEEATSELGLKCRVGFCQVKMGQGHSVPREQCEQWQKDQKMKRVFRDPDLSQGVGGKVSLWSFI